ncbi:MAG TPA: hypothetical protein PLQ35_13820, partial [bacterium]|nr:hypothetical protein [bacterium]
PPARQRRLASCQAETPGLLPGRDAWPTCQAETPGLLARQRRLAYWWDGPLCLSMSRFFQEYAIVG